MEKRTRTLRSLFNLHFPVALPECFGYKIGKAVEVITSIAMCVMFEYQFNNNTDFLFGIIFRNQRKIQDYIADKTTAGTRFSR